MTGTLVSDASNPEYAALDDGRISSFQWKIMVVSGMGFFTDAYDLFVIGIVVALLKPEWNLSTAQVSLLNSTTLAASAVGALVFGRIADILGRKRIYGYEVLILAAGAIASAFSPNYTFLLVARIVLGIGIGGDYPVSATIMSEYSGKRSRGRMVGLVFAMQGAGLVVGPLVASLLLASHVPDGLVWRILLGLGAIPGLAVFYMRRQIHETPRFATAAGDAEEAKRAIAAASAGADGSGPRDGDDGEDNGGEGRPAEATVKAPVETPTIRHTQSAMEGFATIARSPRMLLWLVGTAGCWMLLDFAYYGNTISSPEVLHVINPNGTLLSNTLLQLLIFVVFALPGYAVAIWLLDRTGRKPIQSVGFAMMGLCFLLIGLVPGVTTVVAPFVTLYGVSYFFTEFGPNTTTFVYPAEVFPVDVRTTGHGTSAAAGKMGAFAGAYLFPVMLASRLGLRGAEVISGIVCIFGLALTVSILPEPMGKSLEQLERQAYGGDAAVVLADAA